MEQKKQKFIDALTKSYGIITYACNKAGISRTTYYNWIESDEEFKKAALEAGETQKDFVEAKLIENINANDTTAIIFYLKTKARDRGYGAQPAQAYSKEKEVADKAAQKQLMKKIDIEQKKIVDSLKEENRYTPLLSFQARLTATYIVLQDELSSQLAAEGSVSIEMSREGNERQTISAKEKLRMYYSKQLQVGLRALGMNTDSRTQLSNEDSGVDDFIKALDDSVK